MTAKQIIDRILFAALVLMLAHMLSGIASEWAHVHADVWQVEELYRFEDQSRKRHQAEAPDSLFVPDENAKPEYKAPEYWQ